MNWYIILLHLFLVVLLLVVVSRWFILRIRLRSLTVILIESLTKHDVEYWVDFGTLLGIYRDDDIIWKDEDVDICVVESPELHEKMKKVIEDLDKKGYKIIKAKWDAYRVTNKYKYIIGGSYIADLYINNRILENGIYKGATGENSDIPMEFISVPKLFTWKKCDIQVKVPENIHKTLVWRYGNDYMTPKSGYKGRDS